MLRKAIKQSVSITRRYLSTENPIIISAQWTPQQPTHFYSPDIEEILNVPVHWDEGCVDIVQG
jgi:hypothetical protein